MPNDYYNNTTNPAFLSAATSASVRNQFAAIKAAFDLLPAKADIYDGKVNYGTCTGSSNAYVLSTNMGVTALAAGATVAFLPNHANTGAATINVDTLGAKDIKTVDGQPLSIGDLVTTSVVVLSYNGTHWRQITGSENVSKAYILAAVAAGGPVGDINFQQLGVGIATAYQSLGVNAAGTGLEGYSLSATRALVSDANGRPAASTVTAAELGYLSGVTRSLAGFDKMPVVVRTSNTIIAAADIGKMFSCTLTWSQTLTAAATLGDGWWCIIKNAGTGLVTVDPDAAELIDGNATCPILPLEERLIVCTGMAFTTTVLKPFYMELTSNFGVTKPLSGYSRIGGLLWGGGGGGAKSTGHGGGGGGGACVPFQFALSEASTTTSIAIGAGGLGGTVDDGAAGGNSTIALTAKIITAYGGGGGEGRNYPTEVKGGGGGGALGAGSAGTGGAPRVIGGNNPGYGGGDSVPSTPSQLAYSSVYGGGGGGHIEAADTSVSGGNSVYGGGGGGVAQASQSGAAGTSIFGGNGGAGNAAGVGVAGTVPAGGGGAGHGGSNGGAGAAGKCILWGIV